MKIISIDENHFTLNESLRNFGFTIDEHYSTSKDEIIKIISDYQGIIIRSRFPLNEDFLKYATQLKFIARVGSGMENIDKEYCKNKSIHLINAPEGNRDALAEHGLGMLLTLMHKIKSSDNEIRNGIWLRTENRGDELMNKTVALIGYGVMGKAFAQRLSGFSVKVLFHDILDKSEEQEFAKQVSLNKIFETADIISLHLPQDNTTRYYIDKEFVEKMKKPFYLLNTARGNCVSTEDLIEGLETKKIKGACLDVLEFEKSSFEIDEKNQEKLQRLFKFDNVILTPHIAGWSLQSNEKMAKIIVERILNFYETVLRNN